MIIFPHRKVFKIPLYISRKFDIMIKLFGIVPIGAAKIGPVAQLGAHHIRIVGVVGSNPIRSTKIGNRRSENCGDFSFDHRNTTDGFLF